MTYSPVRFQVDPTSVFSLPSWMEEVAAVAHMLSQTGIISALEEQVQFARARFGTYDTIDFVIVLVSYALSGEPTLAAFYDRLAPFADDVAALFHRQRLPSRSALSRFLAALDEKTLEALRTQFLSDLFERATPFSSPGGWWDRRSQQYVVLDVDQTRQAARERCSSSPSDAAGTASSFGSSGGTWLHRPQTRRSGTDAHHDPASAYPSMARDGSRGPGNGDLRGGLQRACQVATAYATNHQLLPSQILFRLDGGYGDTAVLSDVLAMGLGVIARSRDYALLGRPEVLAVLSRPPVARGTHPESGMIRDLYDCSSIRLVRGGPCVRVVIATHPATDDPPKVGQQRNGLVYELCVSTVLAPAMTANDLLDLYLHRGSFETVLADEDGEQDPDRWCSQTPCGQECWQILSQWVPESSPGIRTTMLSHSASHHGLCRGSRSRASERTGGGQRRAGSSQTRAGESSGGRQRSGVGQRTRLWSSAMGTTIVYRWVSRISVSSATRWDAALPSGTGADPGRMPTRTCRVGAGVVFRVPG
jgi:hypothetical protein